MPNEVGPFAGFGQGLDTLFKHIPKSTLGAVATMMVFVCGLRWQPTTEEPFKTIFLYAMSFGLVGSMLLTLWNLFREPKS